MFVGKFCVCDPASADSVTECGSTWPKMAFVSHPRLVTAAQPRDPSRQKCTSIVGHCRWLIWLSLVRYLFSV